MATRVPSEKRAGVAVGGVTQLFVEKGWQLVHPVAKDEQTD